MDFTDTRPLPGGPLSIDLLNTSWGPDGSADWFDDHDAVRFFATNHGFALPSTQLPAARESLVHVRGLIQRLFESAASSEIDTNTVAEVNAVLQQAVVRLTVEGDAPRISISNVDPGLGLAVQALVNAVEIKGDAPKRIRGCAHESCTLWFLDVSKAGRRRWCSMDQCGNRAKASRHYERSTHAT